MKIYPISASVRSIIVAMLLVSSLCNAWAQDAQTGSVSGSITQANGKIVPNTNLELKGSNKKTMAQHDGSYSFNAVMPGIYVLKATHVGYDSQEKTVDILAGQALQLDFVLATSSDRLTEVKVIGLKSANQVDVTIGKAGLKAHDMPQSMAVVDNELITDQQAQRLSDVVRNVSGISLSDTRGGNVELFFARGYNLGANNIMKNGSRANSSAIPEASTLEKVEVLKGSTALLYGNVSAGAIINMVTKQPKFEYGGEVSLRTGSYGLFKPIGDVYGPISKKLAFRVVSAYEDAASFRRNVHSNRTYVNPSLLYKISGRTEVLFQGDYLQNHFTPDFGIGSIDNKIPLTIPRSSFFNTDWAYNKIRQTTTSANLSHELSDFWKLNFSASYQLFNRDYFSTERIAASADGDWSRNLIRSKTSEDYYTGQLNLTGVFSTGKISHSVLLGTDAEQYLNSTNAFNLKAAYDKINLFDRSKYAARTDEPLATLISRTQTPTYRLGYYAQDLVSVTDKFKVLAGLRWSYQKAAIAKIYDANTGERLLSSTTGKTDKAFSPRIGLVYQPNKRTSLFASYSNSFTTNTGSDVYGANLKPSLLNQYETGLKRDFLQGRLSANLTVYKIINSDLAVQAPFDKSGAVNVISLIKEFSGQTTSDGAEIDISGVVVKGLSFLAGYSYTFMRYTKTSGNKGSYMVGEPVVGNPAHTANGTMFYTLNNSKLRGLKIGASGFYTGKRNGGYNNIAGQSQLFDRLIPVSGFTTFDVSAGYTFHKLSLLGKLSNITNELNYFVHDNYSINPIPPRQLIATLSYKF